MAIEQVQQRGAFPPKLGIKVDATCMQGQGILSLLNFTMHEVQLLSLDSPAQLQ